MKTFDKLLFRLLLGCSFPVLFFLIALTLYYFFQDLQPLYFVIPGLLIGIIIDILYLKKLVEMALDLPTWILLGFYLYYNICIYGMFMGFPVFNLAIGVVAGYYYGIKINYKSLPLTQIEFLKKRVPLVTGSVMLLICISSALIALFEKTIGLELQGMLGLKFQVTRGMVISIILIGGTSLIAAQYYLTRIVMTLIIKDNP
jgi:hypothetical protein